jgi:hypothetical protein
MEDFPGLIITAGFEKSVCTELCAFSIYRRMWRRLENIPKAASHPSSKGKDFTNMRYRNISGQILTEQ